MANTYVAIATVTVGSGGASSIDFTSIPQTYTDLLIKVSGRNTSSANNWNLLLVRFNSDNTTANYENKTVYGFGSTASSFSYSGSASFAGMCGWIPSAARTANTFGNNEIYIPNYAGSSQKSVSGDSVTEGNGSTYEILGLAASLWKSTSAITSITLSNDSDNFAQYSTATLYGIKNS